MGHRPVGRLLWFLMFLLESSLSFAIMWMAINFIVSSQPWFAALILLLGILALNQVGIGFSVLIFQSKRDLALFITTPSMISLFIMVLVSPSVVFLFLGKSLFCALYLGFVFLVTIFLAFLGSR